MTRAEAVEQEAKRIIAAWHDSGWEWVPAMLSALERALALPPDPEPAPEVCTGSGTVTAHLSADGTGAPAEGKCILHARYNVPTLLETPAKEVKP